MSFEISSEDLERIEDYAVSENTPRFPSMTFEDGLRYMCDYIQGNITIEDLLEE